ncbi:hypothetical protein COCCU_14045 [Corynebacterium occultum]|uniref:Secreted protein n=1 Tax=Corynebacterium occultum TaxID=2675219 RepID=A0A6B8W0F1_9CORY|nr:hypothetical protein [Corynebacterium occultum]QGU08699.1 hypothetical protein COCCU_14045 [Corynebacterium occultum]
MSFQAHSGTSWIRTGSFGAVALLSGALFLLPTHPAGAMPLPLNPSDPAVAEQWINPLLRPGESDEEISIQLLSAQPAVLTPGEELELTFALSNHSGELVEKLVLQPQRADPSYTTASARQVIGYESTAYPYYGAPTELGSLATGETREVSLRIPTDPGAPGTLSITEPGVYPLLFGLRSQREGVVGEEFSTERFLLSVPEPAGESPADGTLIDAVDPAPAATPGVSLLYPLAARTDILPGETGDAPDATPLILGSEDLAGELAPGGRLRLLLGEYREAISGPGGQALQDASCIGVDPALLDTVDRMSRGYLVDDARPVEIEAGQRLRDSWTEEMDRDPATQGVGQADAATWLAELRELAAQSCVLALPWGGADLDAVNSTANEWLMREALERGPYLIRRILGVIPMTNVVVPGSGYVGVATAPALGWADLATNEAAGLSADPERTDAHAGLQEAWEDSASDLASEGEAGGGSLEATLDDTSLPDDAATPLPEVPATTVNVLVSENTVWQSTRVDRFSALAPGIRSVSYQGSLAATLAATGILPGTAGYSNPATRFDFRIDSPAARDLNAAAGIRLATAELKSAATLDEAGELSAAPLFVMPPAQLSAGTAATVVDTLTQLLEEQELSPLGVAEYLTPDAAQQERLDGAAPVDERDATAFGAPYEDPTIFSDGEVLRASQQANYTDDLTRIMSNDPAISLTRYEYTAPLRRDLLLALSGAGRRSYAGFWESVQASDQRLNGNRTVLQALRSSVSLIPPGNVYTRASESSPLLIVAQNRLPLPAQAKISYRGPEGVGLNVPTEIRIPAQGSISLQMTADLPGDQERTDLVLWLSTSDGAAISDPVEISVQTRSWTVGTSGAAVLLVLALALALIFRVGRQRRAKASRRPEPEPAATPATTTRRPARRASPRRGSGHADENSGSPRPPGRS